MATVRDFLKTTLQTAGLTSINQPVPSEYLQLALEELNSEVDSLNTRKLWPISQKEETVNIPSQKQISIGPSGDVVSERPLEIITIKYKLGDYFYPIKNVSNPNYNWYVVEETNAGIPKYFRYLQDFPNGIIEFNVIPNSISEVIIVSNRYLDAFALDDEFPAITGLKQALKYIIATNLAERLGDIAMVGVLKSKADVYMERYEDSHIEIAELYSGLKTQGRGYDYRSDTNV